MSDNGFTRTKIGNVCEITSSKRIYRADYVDDGVPFYRGKEVIERHRGNLDVSTELFISDEKFRQIEAKFGAPQAGDLLLTSVGTIGIPFVVPSGERFYFKDGNLTWFRRFDGLDSRFLYYWLHSPEGEAQWRRGTIGVAQPALTIVRLKEMEINLPDLPTQRKIAGILSAYDDLIENNLRRIRILEEMAQSLYREWFVHFRFPGHESTPLVDSPLGPIPEGWEVKKVNEVGNVVTGKTPSKKNDDFYGGDFPFIKTPDMHSQMFVHETTDRLTEQGKASQSNKTLPANSICVSCIGTIGIISITTEPCQTNQQINSVIPSLSHWREFLFLKLNELRPKMENMGSSGATMANMSKGKFESIEFVTPSEDLLRKFCSKASPTFDLMERLQRRNQTLRQTRDLLLPKLLSGDSDS